jgi:hypothetical protein
MSKRLFSYRIAIIVVSLLIVFCSSSYALEDENILEMKRLQAMVTVINLELKSDLDQVVMLQEAIKVNARMSLMSQGRSPDAISFDEVAAAKRLAIQRETAINARLDAILLRSNELDAKKQVLLDRVLELSLAPRTSEAKPVR